MNKPTGTDSTRKACTGRIPWTREAEAALIEMVREHPALWDTQHDDFKKKNLRRSIFLRLAQQLSTMFPSLGTLTAGKGQSLWIYGQDAESRRK